MIRKTLTALAVASALAAMSHAAIAQSTGPSSGAAPYLLSTDSSTSFTSIFTTGNAIGGYQMAGIPDGLGAYDNGNGTLTLLMNHEISDTLGVARGPLASASPPRGPRFAAAQRCAARARLAAPRASPPREVAASSAG